MGILQHAPVVRGDIGLTLGAVDEKGVDLVQVLGGQLHRRGEAGAAQTHQAAGADGVREGLEVCHFRGSDGGIYLLLPVRGDDHGGLSRSVGAHHGGDLRDRTRHTGVDIGGDKTSRLAHYGANVYLIALGHHRGRRSADVLVHG